MGVTGVRRTRRDRLVSPLVQGLAEGQLAVVEGGPGYGKTTLLEQVVALWPHEVLPGAGAAFDDLFIRLAVMAGGERPQRPLVAGSDEAEHLAAMLARLERPVLLVVDDAHLLGSRALTLTALVHELPSRHRLLVAHRGDNPVLDDLTAAEAFGVRGPDLLFDAAELAEVLAPLPAPVARALQAAGTEVGGGWPEGIWHLASAARSDGRSLPAGERERLRLVLAERLASTAQRTRLEQALGLPSWTRVLLAEVLGDDALLAQALEARLPLTRDTTGWWVLPPALRRLLAPPVPARALAVAAASSYRNRGRVADALTVLAVADVVRPLVTLLDEVTPEQAERLELGAAGARLTDEVLSRSPRAGLRLARHRRLSGQREDADRVVGALTAAFPLGEAGELGRLAEGERLRALLSSGATGAARAGALALLRAQPGPQSRALALEVLGRAARRRGGPEDRAAAGELLAQAMVLWRRAGETGRVAELRLRSVRLDWDLGRSARAAERAGAIGARLPEQTPLLVHALHLQAEALTDLGRWDEALLLIDRARRHAGERGWPVLLGHADLLEARLVAYRRPVPAVLGLLHRAEARLGAALAGYSGLCFLAEAADLAAMAGGPADAVPWLEAARRHPAADSHPPLLAEAALNARHGEPSAALRLLSLLDGGGQLPAREQWRAVLLGAEALRREGEHGEARVRAEDALAREAASAQPWAPFVREGALVRALLGAGVRARGRPA